MVEARQSLRAKTAAKREGGEEREKTHRSEIYMLAWLSALCVRHEMYALRLCARALCMCLRSSQTTTAYEAG